ncbi:MAG: RNA polymerase sigma factor [Candidatus Acidiferrales bacterium]
MGSVGVMLPWELRISTVAREGTSRVEPPERGLQTNSGASNPEDMALATACQAGDLHAYERLYRLQGARMKSLARNLLGTKSDAEDAVQETFLKVQRSIASFRGQSSFVTWTFRILVNTCHDLRRSRMRRKEIVPDEREDGAMPLEPRAPGGHPSLRLALERAIAQLTQHQRDIFLLYEVEGFRHAEIAEMLEISETASKNTLFQAKKNLRQVLEAPRSSQAGGA